LKEKQIQRLQCKFERLNAEIKEDREIRKKRKEKKKKEKAN